MRLDDRFQKIATGMSVADAIEAYLDRAAPPEAAAEEAYSADELRAIIEIMFLVAAVDGEVSDEELHQLRASVEALVDIERATDLDIDVARIAYDLGGRLAREGWPQRLEQAAARVRTEDGKAFAFRLAAGIAFVDDFVAHAEAAALETLGKSLGLPSETVVSLLREVHETMGG